MLLNVRYPLGELAIATGYPVEGSTVVVQIIPRGPEAAVDDVLLVDFTQGEPYPVVRIVGGPRRATIRVRLQLDEAGREQWMNARELEGWDARESDDDAHELWVVPMRDGMDAAELVRAGAVLI